VTHELNGRDQLDDVEESLVVVRVEDTVVPALTGRGGGVYESPPQSRERAMVLVRLLLGTAGEPLDGDRWVAPIAGGRRIVAIDEVPISGDHQAHSGAVAGRDGFSTTWRRGVQ
jgi:hypothetical protein